MISFFDMLPADMLVDGRIFNEALMQQMLPA